MTDHHPTLADLQDENTRLRNAVAVLIFGNDFSKVLSAIEANTRLLHRMEKNMSQVLDKLTAEVSEAGTVQASAITLLQGLSQQLKDALGDEKALQALSDQLDAQTNALAAAVTAGTPTPPDAPPAPDSPPSA